MIWTRKKFDAVWKQYESGMTTAQIAEQLGCTTSNIYKQMRRIGYSPAKLAQTRKRLSVQGSKIYTLRKQGKEFTAIAVELGLEPSKATTRKLYMRLVRYCKNAGVIYPRLPKKPTRRMYARRPRAANWVSATAKLRSLTAPSCPLHNNILASALGVTARDLPHVLAELRRRRVIANGLAPTLAGIEAARNMQSSYCVDQVLARAVTAWDTGAPCETLGSLIKTTGFCRSSINVAIISLRERGLLHPRGLCILRPEYT
jgi:hypothetical protein